MSADSVSGPLTIALLRRLTDPEGQRLLVEATELADEDEFRTQEVLRRRYPADLCRAALEIVELRRRAGNKFPPAMAPVMYFDREGLEMASAWEIATYRARRFESCSSIVDLCCGAGGDLLALAAVAPVCGVDVSRLRLHLARSNAHATHVPGLVRLVQGDASEVRLCADGLFADPARRRQGRRIRRPDAYAPSLASLVELRRAVPALAIKVAPGIPDAELPRDCEVEFVSLEGECREAVLYFPPLARGRRRATVLPGPHTLEQPQPDPPAPVAPPGRYLHEPDAAVIRSHLIDALARAQNCWKLDDQIAYLSGDEPLISPFARSFEIVEAQAYNLRRLRDTLRASGWRAEEIKKRRFPIEPEEMRRLLEPRRQDAADGTTPVTLVMTRVREKLTVFICQRVVN